MAGALSDSMRSLTLSLSLFLPLCPLLISHSRAGNCLAIHFPFAQCNSCRQLPFAGRLLKLPRRIFVPSQKGRSDEWVLLVCSLFLSRSISLTVCPALYFSAHWNSTQKLSLVEISGQGAGKFWFPFFLGWWLLVLVSAFVSLHMKCYCCCSCCCFCLFLAGLFTRKLFSNVARLRFYRQVEGQECDRESIIWKGWMGKLCQHGNGAFSMNWKQNVTNIKFVV